MATKTALITGASFGFGYEFTKLFAQDGYNLVLVARSENRLEEIAQQHRDKWGIEVTIIAKDLFLATAPQEIHDEIQSKGIEIDVLVNNAGFGNYGRFSDIDTEKELNLVQLNVVAVTHMTRLFLPNMIQRGSGRILNVASMAAWLPGPYMATYFASKAYVLSFTEAIAEECRGTGVRAMALCPGVSITEFQKTAQNQSALIGKNIPGATMSAEKIANHAFDDLMKEKIVSIPGIGNRLAVQMLKFVPRSLLRRGVKMFNSSKQINAA
ncbi:MAG TPA: short-chain dehydrogenase [Gammaproteobacteria bacterium]|nr:short-chain dehydrogenase [Gammaproteobacteria bacterium]